jgi:microcystin-dependent protein
MSEPFIGMIILVGFNFAPRGWAVCNGQLLPISQNTALFSLLGTTYGGNGQTTFALPDLRGRVPNGMGQGPGLSNYTIGQVGGVEGVTLTVNQMPAHTHVITPGGLAATSRVKNAAGNRQTPVGNVPAIEAAGVTDRCTTRSGDFFKEVPAGGDAYIMKHIIHDWDDERALVILRNIRKAMNRGGRVILIESVVLPGNQPDFAKIIDLEMLLLPGGRERTEAEFRALFAAAGLEMTRIVPTRSPLSVIEAR